MHGARLSIRMRLRTARFRKYVQERDSTVGQVKVHSRYIDEDLEYGSCLLNRLKREIELWSSTTTFDRPRCPTVPRRGPDGAAFFYGRQMGIESFDRDRVEVDCDTVLPVATVSNMISDRRKSRRGLTVFKSCKRNIFDLFDRGQYFATAQSCRNF